MRDQNPTVVSSPLSQRSGFRPTLIATAQSLVLLILFLSKDVSALAFATSLGATLAAWITLLTAEPSVQVREIPSTRVDVVDGSGDPVEVEGRRVI